MSERSWREHLPDLRQLAIWTLESGQRVRAKGGRDGRCYRLETAGSRVEVFIDTRVGSEQDRCQIKIADMDGNWKGALGFMLPDALVIQPGELVAFGETEGQSYDTICYRPFTDEIMMRLDRCRETKKTSLGANQFDVSYFVYWFLIYGEQVGDSKFSNPGNPQSVFDDGLQKVFEGHNIPYTYLNDPTGKFPTAFTLAKLGIAR